MKEGGRERKGIEEERGERKREEKAEKEGEREGNRGQGRLGSKGQHFHIIRNE
jgi:hypothetical protein